MDTSIQPKAGGWMLLAGPRSLNPTLLASIARLAERSPVRVLDGGNRFNAHLVARAARGQSEILGRVTVSRAFTCFQMLSLLESTPSTPAPFAVLDLLNTFYDEAVPARERKRLLQVCLTHLYRLAQAAGGVVSVHPPAVPSPAASGMLATLHSSAQDAYYLQTETAPGEPMRLF